MYKHKSMHTRLFFFLIAQVLVLLIAVAVVSAASDEPAQAQTSVPLGAAHSARSAPLTPVETFGSPPSGSDPALLPAASSPQATLQATEPTTLEVTILSSPWATLDNNDPTGDKGGKPVPKVFVVQAVVTNTGETIAEGLTVTLDYSDPINNWVLLEGEDASREFREPLGPGESYQIYWFATYKTTVGASYQYTVTADASNADPVSTSDNYYGNPEPGKTVKTLGALNTGSTGILNSTAEIVVGAAFTITVEFDLSTTPERAIFSPVGNLDFDPGRYRLLATEVSFYDDMDALLDTVPDRLYFPVGSLSISATRALMAYTFVAYTPGDTRLCPYTTVGKSVTNKYGNDFCTDPTIIPITSTVSISLTKQVTALDIRQGESLTYTISYTNSGSEKLGNVWIWDDVDPDIGSIVSTSGAPDVLTENRVAWFVNNVPPSGNPGSTGTFTFSVHVDGGGQDLADQTDVVNHAFFGIDPGQVPAEPALTSTVTTTVQAPDITIAKTDGLEDVWVGQPLTYTLRITNSGSITATGVVITDQLPSEVSVISAEPMTTTQSGQTLSWNLPDIPPHGGNQVMTIPVTVSPTAQDGTVLTNTMIAEYESEIGHVFATQTATDTTTARVPSFVSFTSASQSADESVGTMTVTLQLDHASIIDISIPFTLGGTATEGADKDYTITASPVVIPAGSLTTTLTIDVNDDLLYEADETIVITMGTPTHADKGSPDVHTATILDNDEANKPTASFTTASQSELEDIGTMTITVQIDKLSGLDTTIPFTLGGAATEGTGKDYTITASPVVIPEGSLTTTLSIDVNDDLLYEADETVVVTMGTPTHADKGSPDTHTATILDNDEANKPTASFTTASQSELEDVGTMTITVQIDKLSGLDTTIPFTLGGTATEGAGKDYTITASPVVIPEGSLTTTLSIDVNDDLLYEADETVVVTMGTPTHADKGSPDTHTATILDNDEANKPTASFTTASQSELEDIGTMTITVQIDKLSGVDATIPFTLGGTATEGADKDYTITASPVVIPEGSLTTTLSIDVNDDLLYEADETVVVTMGTPTHADKGSPGVHTATILDNDEANKPTASFATASQSELEDVGTMTITVQIDKLSGLDTTIPFTLGGTATEGAGKDYTITASPVVIPEGSLTTTLSIDVNDDLLYEADETVVVTMGTPTHADKGSPDVHTATILDNDLPPSVAFTSSGQLGAEDVGTMTVTLQLDVLSGLDTTIPFTVGGTATEGVDQDYTITASPVVIPAGSLTTTIIIYVNVDNETEDPETVIVTMGTPVNATKSFPNVHIATILASLCTCPPDSFEENDEKVEASAINVGVRQAHDFCDDASDWTFFEARAGNVYTITTQAGAQETGWRADTYLALYDVNGRLIAANDDYEGTEDFSSQITWRASLNDVYYLHTKNRAGLYGCYTDYEVWIEQQDWFFLYLPLVARNHNPSAVTGQGLPPVTSEPDLELTVTAPEPEGVVSPSGIITHTCPDAYEIDDTWWQAQSIEDGVIQVHSFDSDPLRYAADKDWMWFDIQPGRTITFTVPSITNTQTLLELYHDPQGAPDAQSTDPSLVWTAPYGGRYYLSVSPSHDPPQVSYGCADTAGYKLLAEMEPRWYLYLPMITRQAP